MKSMKLLAVCLSAGLLCSSGVFSQANTQLSNLVAPTQVTVNLLPKTANTRSLGSGTKTWKDLYMDGVMYRQGYSWLGGEYYSGNTFVGLSAGNALLNNNQSTNQLNTFIGESAGFATTTGVANTFLGAHTGLSNTTGGSNVFIGVDAGNENTTGNSNIFMGTYAGNRNTEGDNNIAIGDVAGGFNKTGYSNTWVGNEAGYYNSTGSGNTMIGDSAGRQSTSYYNTMLGFRSGSNTTSGYANTFLGTIAGQNNTTGSYNTAVGYFTLDDNTTSTGNTALGFSTGTLNNNGNYNTFAGYDADASNAGLTNSMALGNSSRITASNQVRVGNTSITSIGGSVGWSNISDGRVKRNIKENVPGLTFINRLKPVTYNLDAEAMDRLLNRKAEKNNLPAADKAAQARAAEAKNKVLYTGFVAQEVEKAAKELNYDFSGVDAPKNDQDLYSLRYAEFVVPLVKAVQELSRQNDDKDAIIKNQQAQLNDVMERLNRIEQSINTPNTAGKSAAPATTKTASLSQNTPNPFSAGTTISYYIPAGAQSAQLIVSNVGGSALKTIPVYSKGNGQTTITAGELAAGNYFYTLIIDGKKTASKEMTLTK